MRPLRRWPRGLRQARVLAAGHGAPDGKSPGLGTFYMCVGAAGFTAMSLFVRAAAEELPAGQVFALRMFLGLAVLLPWALRHEGAVAKVRRPRLMFARGVLGAIAGLCFFWSLAVLPLAQAVSLNFTLVLFSALFSLIFLGERFRWRRWMSLVAGFFGVLVILRPFSPEGAGEAPAWALALPLVAAVLMAACTVMIKRLSETETAGRILFWHHLWGALAAAPIGIVLWEQPSLQAWGAVAAAGITGTVSALLVTRALRMAETGFIIVFDYLRLPFIALGAWLVFGEATDIYTWAGGAIIAGAGAYMVHREMARSGRSPTAERAISRANP